MTRTADAGHTPAERFLLDSGCPALVPGYASLRGALRRPGTWLAGSVAAVVLLGVALLAIEEEDATAPAAVWWGIPVLAVVLAFAATALGINRVFRFSVRWFFRSLVSGESGVLHVLPLLLVAVTFFFLNNATWQTAGELSGLPLVLTVLLLGALMVVFLLRRGRADLEEFAAFADAEDVRAALPESLRPDAGPVFRSHPLRLRERINLLLVAVFGKLMVAVAVGLAIAAFFVVFGVLTVDAPTVRSWIGGPPRVFWQALIDGHYYTMTAEHLRVAVFLGAFSALYFVVSSASDVHLSRSLDAATNRHLRACLAVRVLVLSVTLTGPVASPGERPVPLGRRRSCGVNPPTSSVVNAVLRAQTSGAAGVTRPYPDPVTVPGRYSGSARHRPRKEL